MPVGNIKSNDQTVTTPGTEVALSATRLFVTSVTVRPTPTNTGNIYLGDSTVSSSDPVLDGTLSIVATVQNGNEVPFDLADIFIDASVATEGVDFWYMQAS